MAGQHAVAVFTPDPVNAANPPLVFYVHADHIDTPRVVIDKNNAIRWRWMAEPFGTTAAENNPAGLGAFAFNLRFPGQYFDSESGLHYNWHRFYGPSEGRYVQSDPIGLRGGINAYAYVDGDPISSSDPEGLTKRGGPNQPYANQVYATTTANFLITQIRQYQPNFAYTYASAPGQGGYTPAMIRSLQQMLLQARQQAVQAPSYVVTTSGTCLLVPQGSALVPVINQSGAITGHAFAGGTGSGLGLGRDVTQLRLMNPTPQYPGGYGVYMNSQVPPQGVNPFTGQTLPTSDPMRHIPF